MLSGVKFIPRDQLDIKDADTSTYAKKKMETGCRKERRRKKEKSYCTSSDSEVEKIKKHLRRRKDWKSSGASSSSSLSGSESTSDAGETIDMKKNARIKIKHRRKKKSTDMSSDEESEKANRRSKKSKGKHLSTSSSPSDGSRENFPHSSRKQERRDTDIQDDFGSQEDIRVVRKEMGLEWMLKPFSKSEIQASHIDDSQEEQHADEVKKSNSRELNPYLKDNGSGYPENLSEVEASSKQLPASSVVGDGGQSWRLKALKRAKEQAAREGRKLEEVVEERWGSVGRLAISVASGSAAPVHAHLRAIKERRKGLTDSSRSNMDDQNVKELDKMHGCRRDYLRDVSSHHPEMKKPKDLGSLSWRKRDRATVSAQDSQIIREAMSGINKYANDGSFIDQIKNRQQDDSKVTRSNVDNSGEIEEPLSRSSEGSLGTKNILSANQLAAKVLQLRMKGKHEEAELLMKEAETMNQEAVGKTKTTETRGNVSRYTKMSSSLQQKEKQEDVDIHLAQKIMQNKQYSLYQQADDEYDFDDAPRNKKHRKKERNPLEQNSAGKTIPTRILTQQERCHFCFENPTRPKHLVVSIANFAYLMLPQWEPIVEGHCCILPMQHESATRSVDDNVWEEIRNFKKCLIKMFAKQEKEVVFIETVIGLAKQQRHCLVECIPLPSEVATEAPLYFKQAIDEAEEEWSQHNAKKLIDTSGKGLRASIPKNFPYFYVEFGLDRGFVHVIDDEANFKSNFGLNVIRGLLRLAEEDMYRRRKRESIDTQKRAVMKFAQEWGPFDWTNELV